MPSRLPSLTGLRFWAALLVVLYHLSRKVGELPLVGPLAWYGRSGVTFFFVLSGFVLAWTYGSSPASAAVFARRRFARIWPLHLLTTGLSLGADAAIGAALPVVAALWSLALVHPWAPSTVYGGNPASWSLGAEAWFYLLFPFLLRLLAPRRRVWLPVGAGCALLGPALWAAGALLPADPVLRGWLLDYLPLTRTPQFVLGVVTGLAARHGLLPRPRLVPAAAAVLGWHLVLVPWHAAVPDALWYGPYSAAQLVPAPLFAALLAAAARRDAAATAPRLLAGRTAVRLGEWSYAWYLVHEVGIRCWLAVQGRPAPGAATLGVWLLLAGGSLAVAAALYRWVERPCERLLRGAPRGRDAAAPLPPRGVRVVRQRRRGRAGSPRGDQPSVELSRLT
ncbi:acyltransferase [Kitasatospora xanthocidica]|uniref:acyltransferase family protein n=1 Tax=Kitasatospora xanthocidica TaxID=83382 RepID=UPI0016728FFB|nr:acyltransferase [Kitasatospora xanthocidica]GHF59332.1 acyltransferase [Kitasatospora xanthocidica]